MAYVSFKMGKESDVPNLSFEDGTLIFAYNSKYKDSTKPIIDGSLFVDARLDNQDYRFAVNSKDSYYMVGESDGLVLNVGSEKTPVYFHDGIPTEVGFIIDTETSLGTVGATAGVIPVALAKGSSSETLAKRVAVKLPTNYGVCSTAAGTAAKVVEVDNDNFVLATGVQIKVKFTTQNTADSPTLNVNGTGAKSIAKYGSTLAGTYFWRANQIVTLTYDGTRWMVENNGTASTTYYGVTKLSSALNSTSTSVAATASTVNTLNTKITTLQGVTIKVDLASDDAIAIGSTASLISPGVSGTLGTGNGGTGRTSYTKGGILYGSSTSAIGCMSAGTANQLLVSGGTNAPTWLSANYGSDTKLIKVSGGIIQESAGTVGSKTKPIYLSAGTLTESDENIGGTNNPMYLKDGELIATEADIGDINKPVYMAGGNILPLSDTQGSEGLPVWLNGGSITACTPGTLFSALSNTASSSNLQLSITVGTQNRTLNLATATTSVYGTTKLSNSVTSTSKVLAATPYAVKTVNDKVINLQGVTIKVDLASEDAIALGTTESLINPGVTGTLPIDHGGTGTAFSALTAGGIIYGSNANEMGCTGAGSANQVLVSGAAGAPVWHSSDVGDDAQFVKVVAGVLTASNGTVGSGIKPVYLSNGSITASNQTVGDGNQFVFLNQGTITASEDTIGAINKPIWMNDGIISELSDTQGSAAIPAWLNQGSIVACTPGSVYSELSRTRAASSFIIKTIIATQERTLTLDMASSSNAGLMSASAQTLGGKKTFSAGISVNSKTITDVATPSNNTDAANKSYVDTAVANRIVAKIIRHS